jgi:polysaccharide pyruvyl transferase WcaK-like protein
MRILIVGGNFTNKGAEAMLWTVVQQLGSRLPEATFVLGNKYVRFGDVDAARVAGLPTVQGTRTSLLGLWQVVGRDALRRPMQIRTAYRLRSLLAQMVHLANQVDAVVDISGYAYGDNAPGELRGALRTLKLCDAVRDRGKPYVFMPQMWGPFEVRELAVQCRYSIARASLVFAREEASRAHLARLLGIRTVDIPLAADIAFLFDADHASEPASTGMGGGFRGPVLGIAPNVRVYERCAGTGTENAYIRALVAIAEHFTAAGCRVRLIPHELRGGERRVQDDLELCRLVEESITTHRDHVSTVRERSAASLKRAIGECGLLVGSRFHSLIAALSQGIPVAAIGWAHKYPELLRAFGLESQVLDHSAIDETESVEFVAAAWAAREEAAAKVQRHLPEVRRSAAGCFDRVAEALTGSSSRGSGQQPSVAL